MPRFLALAMAAYSFFLIRGNMPRLPDRIPTHFGPGGEPNAWSSPGVLWVLLAVQVFGAVLILSIPYLGRRFPHTVNLGRRKLSDLAPAARERVLPPLEGMCGYMALLFSLLFVFIIAELIRVALSPSQRFRFWFVGLFVVGYAAVLLYYLRRVNRVANESQSPAGRIEPE